MLNKQRKILNKIMGKKNLLAIGVNSYSDTNFGDLKGHVGMLLLYSKRLKMY